MLGKKENPKRYLRLSLPFSLNYIKPSAKKIIPHTKILNVPKSNKQKYVNNEFYKDKSIKEIQEIRRKIKTDEKEKNNKNFFW